MKADRRSREDLYARRTHRVRLTDAAFWARSSRRIVPLMIASLLLAAGTALAMHARSHHHGARHRAHRQNYLATRRAPMGLLARPGARSVDLAVSAVTPQGAGALPGKSFKVLVQVKRVGHTPRAKVSGRLSAYLSPTAKLASKKPASGGGLQISVSGKGTSPHNLLNFVVPIGTEPGQYYLVVCVAPLGRYHDSHTKNNCGSSHSKVTVSNPSQGGGGPLTSSLSPGPSGSSPTGAGPTPTGPNEKTQPKEEPQAKEKEPEGENPAPVTPIPVQTTPPAPGPKDTPAASASTVANELSKSESTSFRASIAFLFEGAEPIQKEVTDPSVITEAAAALVHGVVTDTSGNPIGGVRVTVLAGDEYGYTDTATDGSFAMAVNGGQTLTLSYARAGYIPIQSTVQVPVNQSVTASAVALSAYQGQADDINLSSSAPIQVAQGEVESDTSGTRQATLLFSAGTHATMHLPNGDEEALTDMNVRATEFTVGEYGPAAMPGSLPPTSEYTYATAFTVDEAVEKDATAVTFSKPVITYVDNFLGFPTGAEVPNGTYEPASGQWGASSNGLVVKVLSTSGGTATLAVDSGGQAATQEELSELGISSEELKAIASLYKAGDSLWRVPLTHFSSWDFNFLPESERPEPPPPPSNEDPPQDESCEAPGGSRILCDSQAVAEDVPVNGTPFALHYQSDRVAGYKGADAINIPVTSATKAIPQSVDHVDVDVDILGRSYHREYCMPGGKACEGGSEHIQSGHTTGLEYNLLWDRHDGFGRLVTGSAVANVTVTYWVQDTYQCTEYTTSGGGGGGATYNQSEFGSTYGSENGCGAPARELRAVADTEQVPVGPSANVSGAGLGEWDLNAVDSYDPTTGVLHSGDGADTSVKSVAPVLSLFAGGGSEEPEKDGEPATEAKLTEPQGILELPDGGVLIAECGENKVREVLPNGTITTFAGTGVAGSAGDGGQAKNAKLDCPASLAKAPDGSIYVADEYGNTGGQSLREIGGVVRKIATNGIITTVAGGGETPASEDIGKPATDASFFYPGQIALGPDGSLYIADRGSGLIERVDSAGILSIVAYDSSTDTTAGVEDPEGIAVTQNGELIASDGEKHEIVRITGNTAKVIAGTGTSGDIGDGGPATQAELDSPTTIELGPSGEIYFAEFSELGSVVRVISPSGIINTIAGGGEDFEDLYKKGGIPATAARFVDLDGIYANSSGALLLSEGEQGVVYEMKTSLSGLVNGDFLVPTENGSRVDEFTAGGRELAVYDSTNDVKLLSFTYDSEGRITEITDQYGRKTTIQRNGSGEPTEITAPGGQKTVLALEGGRLAKITDPDGHSIEAKYDSDGQLHEFIDLNGNASKIEYDSLGRLKSDTDQAGATTTLSSATVTTPEDIAEKLVTVHLPDGLSTTYGDSQDGYGDSTRTVTDSNGGVSTYRNSLDGFTEISLPDGTQEFAQKVGDPRFGLAAPILESLTVYTPNGTDDTSVEESRAVELTDPNNPLSVKKLTEEVAINGRKPTTTTYQAADRTLTTTSPSGLVSTSTYDSHGDLVKSTSPTSSLPTEYTWNLSTGKLEEAKQGVRSHKLAYDAAGHLTSVTNSAGHAYKYATDADGNVTEVTDQLKNTYNLGYAPAGEMTSLRTPLSAEYKLAYNPVGLTDSFLAPGQVTGTSTEYDGKRQPTKVTLPDGRKLEEEYDAQGRLQSAKDSSGETQITYEPKTELPETLVRTNADKSTETMAQTFDGQALSELKFEGKAKGTYTYAYEDGLPSSLDLDAGAPGTGETDFSYDENGLQTGSGAFTFTRGQETGLVQEIGDGRLAESLAYNEYGQEQERVFEDGGSTLYSEALTRDPDTGRITKRVEKTKASTNTYEYEYDLDGHLTAVKLNGSPSEAYTYEPDGSLKTRQSGGGSAEALTYDSQDRETKLGSTAYEYNSDGQLAKRGSDTFTYGTRPGELQSATAAGKTVTYDYDALGRRVARTQEGKTEQFLYGNPVDRYQLTASISPQEVLTVYTYDDLGRLISFKRGDEIFYVAANTIGSPRVITNEEGKVADEITYDAYGKVLSQTNKSLALPIGFAGGLADPQTGLVRFGIRDYDPASGRFTERDPTLYAGGLNLYAYVGGDPVDRVDPNGTGLTEKEMNETLEKLSKAEKDLEEIPPPPPSLVERAGNALAELRNKAADKVGDLIQACKAFFGSENPASAVPLVSKGLEYAAEQGPISLTPAEAVGQALQKGVEAIQSAPAGMGSGNSDAPYGQVEDGH